MKKTLKGFTLIEMLIVIVIIGILAAVLIPKIGGAREKANDVAVKANVRSLAQGLLQMDLAGVALPADMAALNTSANASKYNFNLLADTTGYTYVKSGSKFVVCGTLSSAEAGGNATAAATDVNRTEVSSGGFFCYKG